MQLTRGDSGRALRAPGLRGACGRPGQRAHKGRRSVPACRRGGRDSLGRPCALPAEQGSEGPTGRQRPLGLCAAGWWRLRRATQFPAHGTGTRNNGLAGHGQRGVEGPGTEAEQKLRGGGRGARAAGGLQGLEPRRGTAGAQETPLCARVTDGRRSWTAGALVMVGGRQSGRDLRMRTTRLALSRAKMVMRTLLARPARRRTVGRAP